MKCEPLNREFQLSEGQAPRQACSPETTLVLRNSGKLYFRMKVLSWLSIDWKPSLISKPRPILNKLLRQLALLGQEDTPVTTYNIFFGAFAPPTA